MWCRKEKKAHIKLLNVEETTDGSLNLKTLHKAEGSAVPKAKSSEDLGTFHAIGFRPEELVS